MAENPLPITDSYVKFANRSVGGKVVRTLGLPKPVQLERFHSDQHVVNGTVLVGASGGARLLPQLTLAMKSISAVTLAHSSAAQWVSLASENGLNTDQWSGAGDQIKELVFDATGLTSSEQTDQLHGFFHDAARSVSHSGRVVVLGTPPEQCESSRQATVQRALEGFTRSLGKEMKGGITSNLVYVEHGAEKNIESTLRFLFSPRSAYVSGQVVRVGNTVHSDNVVVDWKQPLAGRRVLVTGAARGIGLSIAEAMSREGADLILLDIPQLENELNVAAESLGGKSITRDISAEDTPTELVKAALLDGGWDVVVHNAGITRDKKIANMKTPLWQQVVDINLSSQERLNEMLLEQNAIRRNGRIVCVASISGIAGNLGQTNYALSKAGVIGMVQSLAPACANKGISINAVAPGFIETQMTASVPFAIREAGRRMNSMYQGGLPIDVAEAITWFSSPASGGLNGNVVRVCGQSILGA